MASFPLPLQPPCPPSSPTGSKGPTSCEQSSYFCPERLVPSEPTAGFEEQLTLAQRPECSLGSSPDQPLASSLGSPSSWIQAQSHINSHDVGMKSKCMTVSKQQFLSVVMSCEMTRHVFTKLRLFGVSVFKHRLCDILKGS